MAILKVRDVNGNWGRNSCYCRKSTYQYALDGGFTGTEAEFVALLNNLPSYNNPSVTDTVTKHRRYDFTRVARGITYTDEDHSNKIVYGSSFQFEHSFTDQDLVGRTYYGYTKGTLDGGGYISISVPKSRYHKGEKLLPVSYSWNVVNNQDNNQPAINGATIGIYNRDYYDMDSSLKPKMTYFDSYEYFGRINNGAFIGTTNSDGTYQETIYGADREGVSRDITYTATKLTSWGYNTTTQVSNHHYSGVATLDISNLEPGTYRVMFCNLCNPDWPLENIIDGSPYQILNELEIEIVD